MTTGTAIRLLGIGGSTRPQSSSETALYVTLGAASALGAETDVVTGPDLMLPIFEYGAVDHDPRARSLIDKLRWANALVVASPGYHGSMSGMVKNALDYVEELRRDARPYCDGMAVGQKTSLLSLTGDPDEQFQARKPATVVPVACQFAALPASSSSNRIWRCDDETPEFGGRAAQIDRNTSAHPS
jgi:multimeric flavodoxin WrbA